VLLAVLAISSIVLGCLLNIPLMTVSNTSSLMSFQACMVASVDVSPSRADLATRPVGPDFSSRHRQAKWSLSVIGCLRSPSYSWPFTVHATVAPRARAWGRPLASTACQGGFPPGLDALSAALSHAPFPRHGRFSRPVLFHVLPCSLLSWATESVMPCFSKSHSWARRISAIMWAIFDLAFWEGDGLFCTNARNAMTVALLSVKRVAFRVAVAVASRRWRLARLSSANKASVIVSASALLLLSSAELLVGSLKALASRTVPSSVSSQM